LGLVLCGLLSFFCGRRSHGYGDGRCYYGAPMMQNQDAPDDQRK
jgi:hypothetical protein